MNKEIENKFDSWNEKKKKINSTNRDIYIKEREIYWLNMGYNIGHEIYGKGKNFTRPVIIFKKFSRYSFLGIPLTSQLKEDKPYYYEFELNSKNKIIKNTALLSQIRIFSIKRVANKIGTMSEYDYKEMKNKFKKILD